MKQEASRGSFIVVLDDIELMDIASLSIVTDLLPELETVPLAIVATADPTNLQGDLVTVLASWRRHRNTSLLPLRPLDDSALLGLVHDWSSNMLTNDVSRSLVAAARGNTQLARELTQWTLERTEATALTPADHSRLSVARRLVCRAEWAHVVAAVAASRRPLTADVIARAIDAPTPDVERALKGAVDAGVVRAQSWTFPAFVMVHPAFSEIARLGVDAGLMARIRHYLSRELVQSSAGGSTHDIWSEAAELVIAGGERGTFAATVLLQAARSSETAGDYPNAARFARWGLQAAPSTLEQIELFRLLGRCGHPAADRQEIDWAFEEAIHCAEDVLSPNAFAELVAEATENAAQRLSGQSIERLRRALACAETPSTRVRLYALLSDARSPLEMTKARAELDMARQDSRVSPGSRPHGLILRARVKLLLDLRTTDELGEVGAQLRQFGDAYAADAVAALGGAALTRGDRAAMESLHNEFAGLERYTLDARLRGQLAQLRLGMSVLDSDDRAAIDSIREARAAGVDLKLIGPLLGHAWHDTTDRPLRLEATSRNIAGDPRSPSGEEAGISRLLTVLDMLRETSALARSYDGELLRYAERLPAIAELPHGPLWAAWIATFAQLAFVTRDKPLSRAVVDTLIPHSTRFVVAAGVPVCPVGWAIAGPLRVLGRLDDALSANRLAEEVSRRARASHWVARCLIQRADLTIKKGDSGAAVILAEAEQMSSQLSSRALSAVIERVRSRIVAEQCYLTEREVQILRMSATGLTNDGIAAALCVDVATVERHCTNAYRKLGVRNRAQALGRLASQGHFLVEGA